MSSYPAQGQAAAQMAVHTQAHHDTSVERPFPDEQFLSILIALGG